MNAIFVCRPCGLVIPLAAAAWNPSSLTWCCPNRQHCKAKNEPVDVAALLETR
jgi:hypothetical protein